MVEAILAGREAEMAAACDRYAPAPYGYCRSLLVEPADAADVVQETFIIAAGRLSGLRDRAGPSPGSRSRTRDPLNLAISLSVRSLSAGQTTTVHVTMVDLLSSSKTLVVSPGGLTITVNGLRAPRLTGSTLPQRGPGRETNWCRLLVPHSGTADLPWAHAGRADGRGDPDRSGGRARRGL